MSEEAAEKIAQYPASIAYGQEADQGSSLSDMMATVPSYVSRALIYLILAFALVAVLWAKFNKVDVIVAVPATVIPEGRLQILQPAFSGFVQEVRVREGSEVKAGQVLVVYRSSAVSELLLNLNAKHAEFRLAEGYLESGVRDRIDAIEDIIALEDQKLTRQERIHERKQFKYDEQMHRLGLEVTNARGRLRLLEREVAVNGKLAEKGIVAERRLLEIQRIRDEAAIEIERLKSGTAEARINKEIEVEDFNLQAETYQTRLRELVQQIADFKREAQERFDLATIRYKHVRDFAMLNLESANAAALEEAIEAHSQATDSAVIRAPVDGVIAEVAIRNAGEAIERGQTVVTIVPQAVALIAELRIPDKDIGKVREGQTVRFKFEAFPFGEFGVLSGVLRAINPAAMTVEGEMSNIYLAESPFGQDYFRVDDHKVSLLPGMTATAEIRTDEKSVLSLILQPFTDLAKPKPALE